MKGERSNSHLTFQMILYYNALFALLYFPLNIGLTATKWHLYSFTSVLKQMGEPTCLGLMLVGDLVRYYFGYAGNLLERVRISLLMLSYIFILKNPLTKKKKHYLNLNSQCILK